MSYPSSIKQFVAKIDKNASGWYVGPEYFNVPTSSPYEVYLDHVPKDSATTTIGASGGPVWVEVTEEPIGANQYLVDYDYGKVTFSVLNVGNPVSADYYSLGDDIMAEHVNSLQDEVTVIEGVLGEAVAGHQNTVKERLDTIDAAVSASGFNGQRIMDNTVRAGALMDDIKGVAWVAKGKPALTNIYDHENLGTAAHPAYAISAVAQGSSTIVNVQEHIASHGSTEITNSNPHGMTLNDIPGNLALDWIDLKVGLSATSLTARDVGVSGNAVGINFDGPDGNQYIYFYDSSDPWRQALKWNDSSSKFDFSAGINVLGDIAASGNIGPIAVGGGDPSGVRNVGTAAIPFAAGNFDEVQAVAYKTGGDTGVNGWFTAGANTIKVRNGLIVAII